MVKEVSRALGGDFSSKYPKIVHDWRIDDKSVDELAVLYGLTELHVNYVISISNTLSNDHACGRPTVNIHTVLLESKISSDDIATVLKVIETYSGSWHDVTMFRNVQNANVMVRQVLEKQDITIGALREVIKLLRGDQPKSDSPKNHPYS